MKRESYFQMPRSFVFKDQSFPLGIKSLTEYNNYNYHIHENYCELVVIGGGYGTHLIDEMSYSIGPGDVFVIREGQVHAYADVKNIQVNNILFDANILPVYDLKTCPGYQYLFEVDPRSDSHTRFDQRFRLDTLQLGKVRAIIAELDGVLEEQKNGYQFISINIFYRLLKLLCIDYQNESREQIASMPYMLGRLISWLEKHYNQKISVETMCSMCNVSRAGLFRLFKKYFNQTPLNYLNGIRLDNASRLLLYSDLNIMEISEASGFSDSSYFCRIFRKNTGMTPALYREKHLHS